MFWRIGCMLLLWSSQFVSGDISSHEYKAHEKILLYANKVGPFHNPSETYQYYDLPFCPPPEGAEHKSEDLGEVLEGDRMVSTPYDVSFLVDRPSIKLCSKELNAKDLKKFRKAVKDDYYFQVSAKPKN